MSHLQHYVQTSIDPTTQFPRDHNDASATAWSYEFATMGGNKRRGPPASGGWGGGKSTLKRNGSKTNNTTTKSFDSGRKKSSGRPSTARARQAWSSTQPRHPHSQPHAQQQHQLSSTMPTNMGANIASTMGMGVSPAAQAYAMRVDPTITSIHNTIHDLESEIAGLKSMRRPQSASQTRSAARAHTQTHSTSNNSLAPDSDDFYATLQQLKEEHARNLMTMEQIYYGNRSASNPPYYPATTAMHASDPGASMRRIHTSSTNGMGDAINMPSEVAYSPPPPQAHMEHGYATQGQPPSGSYTRQQNFLSHSQPHANQMSAGAGQWDAWQHISELKRKQKEARQRADDTTTTPNAGTMNNNDSSIDKAAPSVPCSSSSSSAFITVTTSINPPSQRQHQHQGQDRKYSGSDASVTANAAAILAGPPRSESPTHFKHQYDSTRASANAFGGQAALSADAAAKGGDREWEEAANGVLNESIEDFVATQRRKVNGHTVNNKNSRNRARTPPPRSYRGSRKLTQPKPFSFTAKDEAGRTSISKRKSQAYIRSIEEEQQRHLNTRFKARPIPSSTLLPKYTQLAAARLARSKEIKLKSKEDTKKREKPFKFEYSSALTARRAKTKEEEKAKKRAARKKALLTGTGTFTVHDLEGDEEGDGGEGKGKGKEQGKGKGKRGKTKGSKKGGKKGAFKAREIPWNVKINLMDVMKKDQEAKREVRIKTRSAELLSQSALPPRMEMWKSMNAEKKKLAEEKERLEMKKKKKGKGMGMHRSASTSKLGEEYTFQPKLNHTIPDFKKLQTDFTEKLYKVKQSFKPTVPIPMKMNTSHARKKDPIDHQIQFKANPIPKSSSTAAVGSVRAPATTLKFEQMKQTTRDHFEARVEKENRKRREQIERKNKAPYMKDRMAPYLRSNAKFTERAIKKNVQHARQSMRERDEEHKKQMKEMFERVRERPLLIETDAREQSRIQSRRKALLAIKDSLAKAGITDFKPFFDQDELEDLDIYI